MADPRKSQRERRVTEKVAAAGQSHNPPPRSKRSRHPKTKASTSRKGKKRAHNATESASSGEEMPSSDEEPTTRSTKRQAKRARQGSPAVVEDTSSQLDVEQIVLSSRPPSEMAHVRSGAEESGADRQGNTDVEVWTVNVPHLMLLMPRN